MQKYIYNFGAKSATGNATLKNLLGGKGANLAEMARMGFPVPAGFTITTEVCTFTNRFNGKYPDGLKKQLSESLAYVEKIMGKKFGDKKNPLLLSVRSGARTSMPGMMDTVLNLGLNDITIHGLIESSGNARFAWDAYRRFIQMYAEVALDIKGDIKGVSPFEKIIDQQKKEKNLQFDTEFTAEDLQQLVALFIDVVKKSGKEFPQTPEEQLWGSIRAVFKSWMNERAIIYRQINSIPENWGTAVNVQSMVFGNSGETSGTGVAFTRDPATGENDFYGEYLFNAQGEDVVAGVRTPHRISRLGKAAPHIYSELIEYRAQLEKRFKDMMDIEFTIENGKLWMLQARVGKRTAAAAIKIAIDMVGEGFIDRETALMRIDAEQLNQILRPVFDPVEKKKAMAEKRNIAKGLNAGPGAATGVIALSAEKAEQFKKEGSDVILARMETSPDDIGGLKVSEGVLTARGGMTSHAALVARQMGKISVAGCESLHMNYEDGTITVEGGITLKEGDFISLDGTTGEVFAGKIKTLPSDIHRILIDGELDEKESDLYPYFRDLMQWSDETRTLGVRANADLPEQAKIALALGAEGIGLCRTEHMFFGKDKIKTVREMILATDSKIRKEALEKLLPLQREDFIGLFRVMKGRPIIIRLLDPPLHEFLPEKKEEIEALAREIGITTPEILHKIESLGEANPMLGFRGCRLGIVHPDITQTQARAIFEAACIVSKEGIKVYPEIMIPLALSSDEIRLQKEVIARTAKKVFTKEKIELAYKTGTMIELPRAALIAGEMATEAEFFSFGTNDLTQTTLGISRDDAGDFLPEYLNQHIFKASPFKTIDQKGVGRLIIMATKEGRAVRKNIHIGICGEHGGDPDSIKFCNEIGLNYVSCSPYRLPIARLAAAQAAIIHRKILAAA
ncbi:MAG: pyruvate, phosphate dikinase [Leptospirales bacterium]